MKSESVIVFSKKTTNSRAGNTFKIASKARKGETEGDNAERDSMPLPATSLGRLYLDRHRTGARILLGTDCSGSISLGPGSSPPGHAQRSTEYEQDPQFSSQNRCMLGIPPAWGPLLATVAQESHTC